MTAHIRRLPGKECLYHVRDRCLYEERLNPGYNRRWRCRVLQGWEASYDDFLLRAEAFQLESATVAGLWESRVERLVEQRPDCAEFCRGGTEVTGCIHTLDELCLLALPVCAGRCRLFRSCGDTK